MVVNVLMDWNGVSMMGGVVRSPPASHLPLMPRTLEGVERTSPGTNGSCFNSPTHGQPSI